MKPSLPIDAPVRYLICDSGFGQLDIAARIIRKLRIASAARRISLVCFNAWPKTDCGYNQLPDEAARIKVFRNAFAGMLRFKAELNIFGCNTLSILSRRSGVYERYRNVIADIPDAAQRMLELAMRNHPEAPLCILGTLTTVQSGFYREALVRHGADRARILDLPCPGLATLIESGPESADVRAFLEERARFAAAGLSPGSAPVLLGLCCTHYGYSASLIEKIFSAALRREVILVNPNEAMLEEPAMQPLFAGSSPVEQLDVQVVSRIPLAPSRVAAMSALFHEHTPELAAALKRCRHDPELFTVPE